MASKISISILTVIYGGDEQTHGDNFLYIAGSGLSLINGRCKFWAKT